MADLTPQQLEKDVKRLNERINEVVKLLGSDSEAYHRYVSKMKSLLPSQYVRVDKDGLFKIARKKELYNQAGEEKIQRAFEQLLKTPTAGDVRKKAKRVILDERKKAGDPNKKVTKDEVNEMAKKIDKVDQFVADNNDMFYVTYDDPDLNKIPHQKKKSYSDLIRLMDAYEASKYEESESIFSDIDF